MTSSLISFLTSLGSRRVVETITLERREWLWSSLRRPQQVDPCPVGGEGQWLEQAEDPIGEEQLITVRERVNRQRPFGRKEWQAEMAAMFGLGSTVAVAWSAAQRKKK
jgi:hypothetical protein